MTNASGIKRKAIHQPASNLRSRPQEPEPGSMQRKIWTVAFPILVLLSVFGAGSVLAQTNENVSPAEICLAANSNISLGARLPRTTALLKSGASLKIVAIGSSSTVGLWVLRSAATYPAVMRQELVRLMPKARIELINSGRIGDTISDNVARLERDVLVHRADLVVWQLGTNDIAWGGRTDGLEELILHGIRILRSGGSDVILMDQQYAPRVLSSSQYSKMQAIIADIARREHVGLFSRFSLMRHSIEAGLSMGALVSWDGLHNSAEGYDCVGRALARAIWSTTR